MDFSKLPIMAILRGLLPDEAIKVVEYLAEQGIRVVEVPLTHDAAVESIAKLLSHFKHKSELIIGAGTLTQLSQIEQLAQLGAHLAVSPHTNEELIRQCQSNKLIPMPGIATASEMFAALNAGADYLKVFPAVSYGIEHIKALKVVAPKNAKFVAVGGVNADNAQAFIDAGCTAVGIGSNLFTQGDDLAQVKRKWKAFAQCLR